MRFDLVSLQLFVAVCEQRNIARAAVKENIAASAVSKRMSDLERSLKAPLFYRSSKGLEPTPAGLELLRHARIVLRDIRQMEIELGDHSAGARGQVRIQASVSTIVQHLPGDLTTFLERYPAVRIDLQESVSQDVVRAVSENAADIGIFGGTLPTTGLRVLPYRRDRLILLVPADHPLAGARGLRFAEVARHDLVGPQRGSFLDSLVMRAAADLGDTLKLRVRVNGFETAASMVEAKLGVALVPEKLAERYAATADLVAVPLKEDWVLREWKICVREAESLPAPIEKLIQHLVARSRKAA
jgi:DNA-binding transcriptional LysR family regulator